MNVGFIGLGNMGNPMAANVLAKGNQLTVFDLRRESADNLVAEGAAWADGPAAAAAAGEVVMMSLPKPPDVEAVVAGPGGVFEGVAPGSVIVDLSTNSPEVVKKLAAMAAERGVGFLDAPVSGGVVGARKGTLAVMVGGDAAQYDRCKPLFDAIGANVFHVGDVGAGNVAKLVNNMLAFISMMGTTEALILGTKAGVDPVVLRDIVAAGSGNSFVWGGGTRAILRDRLRPTFTTTLASKDIGLATELASQLNVPVPMGTRAQELLVGYRDNGFADEDVLATVKALEEQAGFTVRGLWPEDD
ncbi:MAG: NAD(P)-dependent oxidoreductase [Acidimicrobiia bacterium]|nr:NAD(P)-dependent oxidoreductase [Acidimicrobiia bacterium]